MKGIAVLGSTGYIGRASLEVIRHLGPGYRVRTLSANSNWRLLAEQVREFHPARVVIGDEQYAQKIRECVDDQSVEILCGKEALEEVAAAPDTDAVVLATMGAAGLMPAMAAVKAHKILAIANKEPLVMAGDLLMRTARQAGATILPVDSEHSAVLQALRTGARREVRRIIITASGGPFYNMPTEQMANATREQALAHPTWKMGDKVTIDSATLMNKALEIIEAKWLFDLRAEQIEVVIHPQSLVHAFVEFCDGSMMAQVAQPDMRLPIQFALTYPERVNGITNFLSFDKVRALTFAPPDMQKFPALQLGYQAAREGGTMGAVLSGANEVAVEAFLKGQLKFGHIVEVVARVMAAHKLVPNPTLEGILEADRWAREEAKKAMRNV